LVTGVRVNQQMGLVLPSDLYKDADGKNSADAGAWVFPRGNLVGTFRGPCTLLTHFAQPEGVAFAFRRPDHCSVGDGCGGKCFAGAIDRASVSRESSYMPAGCERRAADSGRGQF
jgi:hypothetical protein